MKRMWMQIKKEYRREDVKEFLSDVGSVEYDADDPQRLVLTYYNQSESGLLMAGFKLSQEIIEYLDDFDMVKEE